MPDPGAADLHRLAARLRAAGTEGKGLRRELIKAIEEAAKPIADKISSLEHLKPYLPDRYAAVLAGDLKVSAVKSFSADPKVSIVAKARERKRKIRLLDDGFINHPIYARGARRPSGQAKGWNWSNGQTGGMKAGFFTDAAVAARPDVRERVMQALSDTTGKIAHGR